MKNLSRYLAVLLIFVTLVLVSCGGGAPSPTFKVTPSTKNPQHALKGFEDCLKCHKSGPGTAQPADHTPYKNSDCRYCHTVK